MKLAMVQLLPLKSKQETMEKAEAYIRQAVAGKAEIVVLPEGFCSIFSAQTMHEDAERVGGAVWTRMSELAKELQIYLVAGSMPELAEDGNVYNTAFVFDRTGKQIARHRKIHLFDIDVEGGQYFKESNAITPGNEVTVFDTEYCKIGLAICYDFRFPELSRLMVDEGAEMVIVPAAFNMTTGPAHWEVLFRSRAIDNQIFTVGTSRARDPNGAYVAYGNSIVVSPWGDVVLRLDEKEQLAFVDVDLERVKKVRREIPMLAQRRKDLYTLCKNPQSQGK